jgi:glycosyltransferase involved in cell wall biosynthesis
LQLCKFDPLYRRVYWHAANEDERLNILRVIPEIAETTRIFTAPNLYPVSQLSNGATGQFVRSEGPLRVLFVSRIAEMKNLKFAVRIVAGTKTGVEFNIFGPHEDDCKYWRECERELSQLPKHIQAKYHGEVSHDEVHELYSAHDVLLLPSKGESFGHVILESLRSGCPVLISDRTPWKGLEASGVGWTFSLDSVVPYQKVLDTLADTPRQERAVQRQACVKFANAYISNDINADQSRRMFQAIADHRVGIG